ncbi:transglutaminase TgpA family protein [Paenibacillus turpanensis]|uniref:transglutaminase TgpA family protein n=1 Tax=Paenibacillus turpanensis TaxID=2689078 RepID=UPI00140C0D78|nr:transglutaminase domain-containing protein [Paenibacillus turpanensis]
MKGSLFSWRSWLPAPERSLMYILCAVFLYQYIVWFDTFWVNETKPIVVSTLIATLLVEIIARIPAWLRRAVQLLLLIWIHFKILDIVPVPTDEGFSGAARLTVSLMGTLTQLNPFIWFSVGTWFIFLFVSWWASTKLRIICMIGFSVVAFAVIDSFSPYYMWTHVAFFVGTGLLMIVVRHFSEVRSRHPEGWKTLKEYPLNTLFLVGGIVTVTVLLGVAAPDIRPLVTDPYTAWKAAKGEAVPALGKTTIIEVGAMDASSGYSRNDSALGGGFNFDYTPVFEVDTSRRAYWRGETRTVYTGEGWEPSAEERRVPVTQISSGRQLPGDGRLNTSKLETVEVTQKVKLLSEQAYPVLFGAYRIQSITFTPEQGEPQPDRGRWSPQQETARWIERGPTSYPQTYEIVSQMPVVSPDALRALPSPVVPSGLAEYTSLPPTVTDRVRQLAADITAEAATPYDKVKALEKHLTLNYPYTTKPDISLGTSNDFVDRFLFEIKEGYCDYFSTAMVVMSRSLGLPARWVKGYAPGSPLVDEEQMFGFVPEAEREELLNGPNVFTVRNSDAHSWAEVYFEGYGWIPFEPTPGFVMPSVQPETEAELPETQPLAAPEAAEEEKEEASTPWLGGVWAAAALLTAAALWLLNRRFGWVKRFAAGKRRASARASDRNGRLVAEFERLLKYFRRKGLVWQENETVREMAVRWTGRYRFLQTDLLPLIEQFERAKYSKAPISEEEYRTAEARMRSLREKVK